MVSYINSTLSVAGGSVMRCTKDPPSPPPLQSTCQVNIRPFSTGPHWGLPQKLDLPPLATTPLLPPHTESLCCQMVQGNSWPRCSLLRSFLPPLDGRYRRCRCRHCGVRQRRCGHCLGGAEASLWTAATLPPAKWWKYEGLGLNYRWWQQSELQVTLMDDMGIENFNEKVNCGRWWRWKKAIFLG